MIFAYPKQQRDAVEEAWPLQSPSLGTGVACEVGSEHVDGLFHIHHFSTWDQAQSVIMALETLCTFDPAEIHKLDAENSEN